MGKAYFLIVDDDPMLRRALERLVARYFLECGRDVNVIVVDSGPEAFKSAELLSTVDSEAEWGLLTDYDMPLMNGAELIDKLDAKLGTKLVWRLLLTGELTPERRTEIEAKQAFIDQKPIAKKDLESYLYTFLTSLA